MDASFVSESIERIVSRLKHILGDLYDDFYKQMRYEGVVVSGSFVLNCLLNEDKLWEGSDVDIYVKCCHSGLGSKASPNRCCVDNHYFEPDNANETFGAMLAYENCVYNLNTSGTHHYLTKLDAVLFSGFFPQSIVLTHSDRLHDSGTLHISLIRTYKSRNALSNFPPLQVIHVQGNPVSTILETFDLDILCNIFGVNSEDGTYYLHITAPKDVMTKETNFYFKKEQHVKCVFRANKYYKRGIRFRNLRPTYAWFEAYIANSAHCPDEEIEDFGGERYFQRKGYADTSIRPNDPCNYLIRGCHGYNDAEVGKYECLLFCNTHCCDEALFVMQYRDDMPICVYGIMKMEEIHLAEYPDTVIAKRKEFLPIEMLESSEGYAAYLLDFRARYITQKPKILYRLNCSEYAGLFHSIFANPAKARMDTKIFGEKSILKRTDCFGINGSTLFSTNSVLRRKYHRQYTLATTPGGWNHESESIIQKRISELMHFFSKQASFQCTISAILNLVCSGQVLPWEILFIIMDFAST